jgi:hypothetical protein
MEAATPLDPLKQRLGDVARIPGLQGEPRRLGATFPSAPCVMARDAA